MEKSRRTNPFVDHHHHHHHHHQHGTFGSGIYKIRNNKINRSTVDVACNAFKDNLANFLQSTTLHGLRYTGDHSISLFERTFFIVSFIIVFFLSSYFISIIYTKWSATPIIIGISPTPTYISSIPFPAVTICNLNQAMKSRVQNVVKKSASDVMIVQSLCGVDSDYNITNDSPLYSRRWSYVKNLLLNVSQPCREMMIRCQFGSVEEHCDDIFETLLSDEGLCCTFNSVHPRYMYARYNEQTTLDDDDDDTQNGPIPVDWTPETGFGDNLPQQHYPRRALGTGSHMGLTVVLNASANDYYCSSTSSVGFKVLLHSPIESPKIANYGFLISTGQENRVLITPSYMDASSSIRHINQRFRHCLFANEANLTFYRTYSKKNCELECESRIIEEECGCVLYYMPKTSSDTVICSFKDYGCTQKIQRDIELSTSNRSCDNCLPACFELSYTPQISSTNFANKKFIVREALLENFSYDFIVNNLAIIHIYYASNSFRSRTKEELIGFTEFLSSTGGLLGLFMGFSVVSFIEIIYFMSLRPYCSIRKRMKKLEMSCCEKIDLQMVQNQTSTARITTEGNILYPMNTKNKLNTKFNVNEIDLMENLNFKSHVSNQFNQVLNFLQRETPQKPTKTSTSTRAKVKLKQKPLPYYE